MTEPLGSIARRLLAGLCFVVLLALASGCTGGDQQTAPRPSPSRSAGQPTGQPAGQLTGPAATLHPKPVPLHVEVTRVHGKMSRHARMVLAHVAGRAISTYFQNAFLAGHYPGPDLGNAFASFSKGAADQARHDRSLLTNAALGADTVSVTAKRQSAYLSVLAPHKVAAGITAQVDLKFLVDHAHAPDQLVTVRGRLLLTRKQSGGWQIFGYHLSRSSVAAKGASR